MACPFSHPPAAHRPPSSATLPPDAEWHCRACGRLLGIRRGARLHVRLHGHDYTVSLPAEAICRGCGKFNRI